MSKAQISEEDKKSSPVLHVSELVDLAYDIAKDQFGDKFFSFSSIWSKVWRSAERFSKEKVDSWIGYFYTEMATDPRFVIYGFHNWRLREFIPLNEVKKLEKTIFSDENVFEEEYEAYISSVKNKNKEVEMVMSDDSPDDIVVSDENIEGDDDSSEGGVDSDELFEAEEE